MNKINLGKVVTIVMTAVALMISVRAIMSIIKDIVCNEHSLLGIVYRIGIIFMITSLTILAIKFLTYEDR
jgi:ABC-type arginine/histidine transport system permease subunit